MPELDNKPLPPKKACEYCGTEFQPNAIGSQQKFCSKNCGQNFRYKNKKELCGPDSPRAAQKLGIAICAQCGAEYKPNGRGRPSIYCSAQCRDKSRNIRGGEKRRADKRASYKKHFANNSEKILAKNKEWQDNNHDKMLGYWRAYSDRNREKVRAAGRLSRANHRDEALARQRAYREAHPEKDREYRETHREEGNKASREWQAKYREEHREEHQHKQREWYRLNPATYLAKNHRRRTRKTSAGGSYTQAEWDALLDTCGHRCLWCGRDDVKLTADHITPVSMGGTSNIDNIQPLCLPCNARKHNKIMDFRRDDARTI